VNRPVLVEIVGGLDLSTVWHWEAEAGKAGSASRTVVVDLTRVDFVDSAGVHGLFRMLGSLNAQGKRAFVVAPHGGRVRRLLEILELQSLACLCETREEALGAHAT
jgi:anti-anti-sigma factor